MPRGPLSARLIGSLSGELNLARHLAGLANIDRPICDEDLQLSLYLCYELHYRGFADVDARWEWDPMVLDLRSRLESTFEKALAAEVALGDTSSADSPDPSQWATCRLRELASRNGPSLSEYMMTLGTIGQFREFCVHRSPYQLKEADPHTWVLPRLSAGTKGPVAKIQFDEYGNGNVARMHSVLFANTMRSLGLDDTYGAYLDVVPGVTLATVNLISMLGLHRRHRGRVLGHLALFEMTSALPMSRYASALRRFGLDQAACEFYDVHVEADNDHSAIAQKDMVTSLIAEEPEMAPEVVEGAMWLAELEGRFSEHLLGRWQSGASSLLSGPFDYPKFPGGAEMETA